MMDDENGVVNRGKRKAGGKKQSNTKEDKRALLKEETIDIDVSNASWKKLASLKIPFGRSVDF